MKCFAILIAVLSFSSAFGWTEKGHSMVAQVAYHYLSDSDKLTLTTAVRNTSLEAAANWMNEVRNNPAYSLTATWHDVQYPKGTTYVPGNATNALNALTFAINELRQSSKLSKGRIQYNLYLIIHLTADLHQPMHTGYPEDDGGKDYSVTFFDIPSNLRLVWDSSLIAHQSVTLNDCLTAAEHIKNSPAHSAVSINLPAWLTETRALTEACYPAGRIIGQEYADSMTPVVIRQLALAGLRLAAVLHKVLNEEELPAAKQSSAPPRNTALPPDSLRLRAGQTVYTCGNVFRVRHLTTFTNTPTYVNIGAAYPDSPLTLIIWQKVRDSFSYEPEELNGKAICVTGTVVLYKGNAQIVVQKESDISIP